MDEKWRYGLWGAAFGAGALAVAGFTWGGWMTGGGAEAMTLKRSQAAVVAVLTPMCIERFKANANASANLVELKNNSYAWTRRDYIVKGGWATFGQDRPFELADACAEAKQAVSLGAAVAARTHRFLPEDRRSRLTDVRRCTDCLPVPVWG